MEDLLKTVKGMFNDIKKDDDKERYLHFSPKYNPAVKVLDWFLPLEANPKDNDPYHPPGGNYFLSTYKRFGTEDVAMETTTQAMLRQICLEQLEQRIQRPLVSSSTDRLLTSTKEDFEDYNRADCDKVDFTTTYDYDFRHPFPYRKIQTLMSQEKPDKRFGLVSKFTPTKICETEFLDDDLNCIKPKKSMLVPPYETHDFIAG